MRRIETENALRHAKGLERLGTQAARAATRTIRSLADHRDALAKMDREAATHAETVICLRTDFSGDPPYVGWKGLGLALSEALDERDRLRAEIGK